MISEQVSRMDSGSSFHKIPPEVLGHILGHVKKGVKAYDDQNVSSHHVWRHMQSTCRAFRKICMDLESFRLSWSPVADVPTVDIKSIKDQRVRSCLIFGQRGSLDQWHSFMAYHVYIIFENQRALKICSDLPNQEPVTGEASLSIRKWFGGAVFEIVRNVKLTELTQKRYRGALSPGDGNMDVEALVLKFGDLNSELYLMAHRGGQPKKFYAPHASVCTVKDIDRDFYKESGWELVTGLRRIKGPLRYTQKGSLLLTLATEITPPPVPQQPAQVQPANVNNENAAMVNMVHQIQALLNHAQEAEEDDEDVDLVDAVAAAAAMANPRRNQHSGDPDWERERLEAQKLDDFTYNRECCSVVVRIRDWDYYKLILSSPGLCRTMINKSLLFSSLQPLPAGTATGVGDKKTGDFKCTHPAERPLWAKWLRVSRLEGKKCGLQLRQVPLANRMSEVMRISQQLVQLTLPWGCWRLEDQQAVAQNLQEPRFGVRFFLSDLTNLKCKGSVGTMEVTEPNDDTERRGSYWNVPRNIYTITYFDSVKNLRLNFATILQDLSDEDRASMNAMLRVDHPKFDQIRALALFMDKNRSFVNLVADRLPGSVICFFAGSFQGETAPKLLELFETLDT